MIYIGLLFFLILLGIHFIYLAKIPSLQLDKLQISFCKVFDEGRYQNLCITCDKFDIEALSPFFEITSELHVFEARLSTLSNNRVSLQKLSFESFESLRVFESFKSIDTENITKKQGMSI